ncbi:origin-associated protein OapB [Natrialba magadii ATCC 43099]|uniref:Origin-associated protein OapB n=3 Tax=Natrialba TaxID=63742 RepID=D3SV91_NATMM|nr:MULTISPECIES: DUF2073 domain-containing protein [Natrialba]ADD05499.1 origin-associated protein OapB [Natrialba magadii ATCC 43099]ELY29538.1 hypothetical protein C500_10753 [Natrialba magadii ATCC 43099]ELY90584.1 hypothetical protein C483_11006 [Natrialba hulunbeirensis JCM 10989]ELZ03181.1 hypothetical protein C482_04144 [Natrialba chahannaoensis JCM 10990]OIB55520.1 hypothetical protein BBD46_04235 [Natrialba sp. SSL1]
MPTATNADDSDPPDSDGVQIDLISGERMDSMATMEKIRMILDGVHDGNIVILEEGLTPDEESRLIEVTMSEISPDEFNGIEIETYPKSETRDSSLLGRLMGSDETEAKLTVIGPANQIETLHKDETLISALVSRD